MISIEEKFLDLDDDAHLTIGGWMINRLNLSGNELLIFAVIFGVSQDRASFFCGRHEHLCAWTKAPLDAVETALNSLLAKELITKVSNEVNGIIYRGYQVNPDKISNKEAV
jgi:hypothetical protein